MFKPGAGPITVESRVDETITRHPSPGQLYATSSGLTLGEYAALNNLAIERLFASLNAVAEAEQVA